MAETHSPILKPAPVESTSTLTPTASQTAAAPCEERRVTFDIGDSDDAEPKEGEISNGNGKLCVREEADYKTSKSILVLQPEVCLCEIQHKNRHERKRVALQ